MDVVGMGNVFLAFITLSCISTAGRVLPRMRVTIAIRPMLYTKQADIMAMTMVKNTFR